MERFFVEGVFLPKKALKWSQNRVKKENAIEPFSRIFWARDSSEALHMAEESLEGGKWIGSPKVSRTSEERHMRELGAPELPGFGPFTPMKRK
jgi:hypothetical protein